MTKRKGGYALTYQPSCVKVHTDIYNDVVRQAKEFEKENQALQQQNAEYRKLLREAVGMIDTIPLYHMIPIGRKFLNSPEVKQILEKP